jgi:hypothetical protein
VQGFFDGLTGFLSQATERGFIGVPQQQLVQHGNDVGGLLSGLVQAAGVRAPGCLDQI